MGQTLSAPATQKLTSTGGDERYIYAVSEMQGWRISMEDTHATILDLEENGSSNRNAFFAVYDGHGGPTVAQFAGSNVHRRLVTDETYHERHYDAALKRAFLGTDEDILADPSYHNDPSGCTAVAALFTSDRKLYVANAGDSRSVISVKGQVKPLSYDHKPQNAAETSRVIQAGGFIENGRVNANLALSRAIGDFEFKKNYALSPERQIITADPDVIVHELTDEDEFLVLACDGIWDCLTSQQVVDSVRRMIHDGLELTDICESLMHICLSPSHMTPIGCDNMTIIIVALLNGRTREEWYAWVKDRVARQYGYDTPVQLPVIFSAPLAIFPREESTHEPRNESSDSGLRISSRPFRAFSNGPISFHPGSNENDDDTLEFEPFKVDEDSDEETAPSAAFISLASMGRSKDELAEFLAQYGKDKDDMNHGDAQVGRGSRLLEHDEDMDMSEPDDDDIPDWNSVQRHLGKLADMNLRPDEAPLPPLDATSDKVESQPLRPSGVAPSGAVEDTSDIPVKTD